MVTVTCEKTGIQFEAASKRTKNHPRIMTLISDSYRDNCYNEVLAAIKSGKEQGFTTIEQFEAIVKDASDKVRAERDTEFAKEYQRKREEQDAKRQRHFMNRFLFEYGYTWIDLGYPLDEEIDNMRGSVPEHDWHLKSKDGRSVSVKQAMQEIVAQNAENKFANEWLESHK